MAFKLRSGNKITYKDMGGSPFKLNFLSNIKSIGQKVGDFAVKTNPLLQGIQKLRDRQGGPNLPRGGSGAAGHTHDNSKILQPKIFKKNK